MFNQICRLKYGSQNSVEHDCFAQNKGNILTDIFGTCIRIDRLGNKSMLYGNKVGRQGSVNPRRTTLFPLTSTASVVSLRLTALGYEWTCTDGKAI